MSVTTYNDIKLEITGQIGIIKFNRPKSLNSFGGKIIEETIAALRELNEHPTTVFTVLTGEGRFFSAGADIRASGLGATETYPNVAETKLAYMRRFLPAVELLRSLIDHTKVFVLALNGPAVGGGAAWFTGVADIVLASRTCYLQIPFSALGLVPENGSALSFSQSLGVHRANEVLMFGRKLSVEELEAWGMVNRVIDHDEGGDGGPRFHDAVRAFLEGQLEVNDGVSMREMKRLQNKTVRDQRMLAVWDSMEALAERFVDGAPVQRFVEKKKALEGRSFVDMADCASEIENSAVQDLNPIRQVCRGGQLYPIAVMLI